MAEKRPNTDDEDRREFNQSRRGNRSVGVVRAPRKPLNLFDMLDDEAVTRLDGAKFVTNGVGVFPNVLIVVRPVEVHQLD